MAVSRMGWAAPYPSEHTVGTGTVFTSVDTDPDPVLGRVVDPDLFGRIGKIFTGSLSGSGSYRYFDNVKLYKQGSNILKIEVLHIFR